MTKLNVQNVAIYARVSTEDQTTENQVRILVKEARHRGWEFEVFEETMSSRNTRPIKAEVLQRLRDREFDGVLVLKLDRWARSTMELLREVEELYEKRIAFIALHDHIDLSTPSGKLQFQIMAAFAEFERNIISQRTKEGLARKRATGWKHNRGKDKRPRRKSGYYLRYAGKRKRELRRKKRGANKGGVSKS